MTKQDILNGMSEEEFYQLYPTKESWEEANKMKLGGLSGAPHNGQPTADQFFSYGSHALDKFNIPFGHFAYGGPIYPAQMGAATPVPAMDPDAWDKMYGKTVSDTPAPVQTKWPTFNTPGQFDAFVNKNPNLKMYSPQDLQGLGLERPAGPDPEAIKRQQAKATPYTPYGTTPEGAGLFRNQQGQAFTFQNGMYNPYTAPNIVANKKHGGEPCYECGGMHKAQYGFNSGVNYGSFSVPMQQGGIPGYDPATGYHMLAAGQQSLTPAQLSASGYTQAPNNPNWYNQESGRFYKSFSPGQPGYQAPAVANPNAGPVSNPLVKGNYTNTPTTGTVGTNMTSVDTGFKTKSYPVLGAKQDGGSLDPSNNQMYPVLDFGGLKSIIDSAAKHMKKAYGGDLAEQGGNQDYKKQYRANFDNYIKQNTYNAIVDAEHQAMMDELQQMPYAQYGKSTPSNMICTTAGCFPRQQGNVNTPHTHGDNTAQREAMAAQIAQRQGQQQGFFGNFADMYAPTVGQNQMSVFGSLFPANFTRGYEFSNKDYAQLKEMGDQGQITGIQENYGPLARLLGKTGRRMFGPKSVTFGVMGPGSTSEQQTQQVENVGKGAYDNPSEGMESGQLFKDYNKGVTPVGKQHADFMPSNLWKQASNQAGPQNDGWNEMMNAPVKKDGPRAFQQGGGNYNEFTLNRQYSGQEDLWKYAPGVFNAYAAGIEQRHDRPETKAAQLAMMTPGSDTGPFSAVPASGRIPGDWNPLTGTFRENQMVPVQFQGNLYGYSQMGGELEEGEEADLSPEEIAELKAQGYEIEELD